MLGAMLAWNAWYVGRYGANIPRADEWRDVSVLLGDQPLTLDWLWTPAQRPSHPAPPPGPLLALPPQRPRLPLGARLQRGGDGPRRRPASFASPHALRGHPSAMDAFFPLLLLGPGHYMTFLWAFQVQFAPSAALFFAAVALIVAQPNAPEPRALALLGSPVPPGPHRR